jgi:PPR repeat
VLSTEHFNVVMRAIAQKRGLMARRWGDDRNGRRRENNNDIEQDQDTGDANTAANDGDDGAEWQRSSFAAAGRGSRDVPRPPVSSGTPQWSKRGWKRVVQLLRRMRAQGCEPNAQSYEIVANSCLAASQYDTVLETFDELLASSDVVPTRPTVLAAVQACEAACVGVRQQSAEVRRRFSTRAVAYVHVPDATHLRAARRAGILDPNRAALGASMHLPALQHALHTCGMSGDWEGGLRVMSLVRLGHLAERVRVGDVGVRLFNEALAVCALASPPASASAAAALDLLAEMGTLGIKRDASSFANAMAACTRAGDSARALELFDTACEQGFGNMRETLVAAIEACVPDGRWETALELLDLMGTQFMEPPTAAFNSVLLACAAAGEWRPAIELLWQMQEAGVPKDSDTFVPAIEACEAGSQRLRALALFDEATERRVFHTRTETGADVSMIDSLPVAQVAVLAAARDHAKRHEHDVNPGNFRIVVARKLAGQDGMGRIGAVKALLENLVPPVKTLESSSNRRVELDGESLGRWWRATADQYALDRQELPRL